MEVSLSDNLEYLVTYILSLDGMLRSNKLFEFCEENDLNPVVIIGFDGRNKSKSHFKDKRHDFLSWVNMGRRITNEEIACGLGHLKIYNTAKDLDLTWFLICEDDTFPRESLVVEEIYQVLKDWQSHFSLQESKVPTIIHLGPPLQGEIDNPLKSQEFDLIIPLSTAPLGTYAYLINSEAINLICKHPKSQNFISPCDWPTQWVDDVQFYRTKTPKLLTGLSSSYIESSGRAKPPKNIFLVRIFLILRGLMLHSGFAKILLKFNGFK